MKSYETFSKETKVEELIREIRQELLKFSRPATEVVMDEIDFCNYLKISRRHAANLRSKRQITYSKSGGKIYYLLSDILKFISSNQVKAISERNRFNILSIKI